MTAPLPMVGLVLALMRMLAKCVPELFNVLALLELMTCEPVAVAEGTHEANSLVLTTGMVGGLVIADTVPVMKVDAVPYP